MDVLKEYDEKMKPLRRVVNPFVLLIPLYPKLVNKSITDTFNFVESLVNVKLKDIDAWAAKNISTNWVTERTKIFRKAI